MGGKKGAMTDKTFPALTQAYFDAWTAHDGQRLAALFVDDGIYEDPTTPIRLMPNDLTAVIHSLAAQFSDFAFEVVDVVEASGKAAVEWILRGANDGPIKTGVPATGRKLLLSGVDVLEIAEGKILAARRIYDRRAMMEQLGLQVVVEPYQQGPVTYGYSIHASSGNANVPGVIGLTWLLSRDESERDRVNAHYEQILANFLKEPGFIGIVAGFAGARGFTCTAWEDEASLYRALDLHHAEAKQDFRTGGISPGVWTSVWKPHHINRVWVRCSSCDAPNDVSGDHREWDICGSVLPPRPTYW